MWAYYKMTQLTPNQTYYLRNNGKWYWYVHMKVTSIKLLWKSEISLLWKFQLTFFRFAQIFIKRLHLFTEVSYQENDSIVYHRTCMRKWGIPFFKGKERILLHEDGIQVMMEGDLFYWPLLCIPFSFANSEGKIERCTCRAHYQFPLFGVKIPAHTQLDGKIGQVKFETPWLETRFELTQNCLQILQSRFGKYPEQ